MDAPRDDPLEEEAKQLPKQMLDLLSHKKPIPSPQILFAMIAGSYAFNMNVATSDKDYFAVYGGHIDSVLTGKINGPPASFDGHNPYDYIIYEAEYYCSLLLKGNPKVIEPLFTTHRCFISDEWKELTKIRRQLITRQTLKHYISYAMSQITDDMETKPPAPPKRFYHALRLLGEADRMLSGGEPRVWLDGPERDYLLSVRRGEHSNAELKAQVLSKKETLESRLSSLPETTPVEVIDQWLVQYRLRTLTRHPPRKFVQPAVPKESLSAAAASAKAQAEAVLASHHIRGEVLCVVPSGSKCYGTSVAESSDDFVAIFVVPTAQAVSMTSPAQRIDSEHGVDTKGTSAPTAVRGILLLELGYAASLLKSGNHRVVEALHYDGADAYETVAWQALKSARKLFCGAPLANQYSGLFKALEKKDDPKSKYLSARLISQAADLIQHRELHLCVEARIEPLMKIRKGEWSAQQTSAYLKELLEKVSGGGEWQKEKSTERQTEAINKLCEVMVAVRKELVE